LEKTVNTKMGSTEDQMKDASEIMETISFECIEDDLEEIMVRLSEIDEPTHTIVMNEISSILFLAKASIP